MRCLLTVVMLAAILVTPTLIDAQIYPPKPGVELPEAYFERVKQDRNAFRFEKAWIEKARQIRENREKYIREHGKFDLRQLSATQLPQLTVSGTTSVPVFTVKFSNTGADPYPASNLQQELFDGPWTPRTLTQYYTEISYGNLNVVGTVYDWVTLANTDLYYEGGCKGLCEDAKVGELIEETLIARDPSVDFAIYDNDGPDGVPNSGDDDGYVDFIAFVHPEAGAECGNNNIWSHRSVVATWPNFGGAPYTTNDPSASGGNIKVWDYVIQPAFACGGVTMIQIGVFCHEFGHAFGLPDLYDTNGGSAGIGHWGLMGSGSWNTTTSPAHMNAWCKSELGWTSVLTVGSNTVARSVPNIEFNNTIYRLDVTEEKWRRTTDCAINGSYSMRCGLNAAEAALRNWPAGGGYGNGWKERVRREFSYNGGDHPVTLQYECTWDSEEDYDYTRVHIDVGGTVTKIREFNLAGSGTQADDLTPYLSGSGAGSYTVIFEFDSDYAWSDEDSLFASTCGGFVFDDVSVTGGGESYSTDFETYEDGWYVDMTNPNEYFYVENRQPLGSEGALHGSGGLAIWHVDQAIAISSLGNSGGESNIQTRGVTLQQADGLENLLNNANRGDGGDPYPGTSGNMFFDNATNPNSLSNNANATNVLVQLTSGNGDPITTLMRGGWFPPTLTSNTPTSGQNTGTVQVDLLGAGLVKGASVKLAKVSTIIATSVEWIGHGKVIADFDLTGKLPGIYDVIVTNPGSGTDTLTAGFEITGSPTGVGDPVMPKELALHQNAPNPFNPTAHPDTH
jgi:M6 family metalloprotease-like protein